MGITMELLGQLDDREFEMLEQRVQKLLAVWEIKNLRGQAAVFHDDQHIGEHRRELKALGHPAFDVAAEMRFRSTPVVDNLAGNSLIHPLTTPVIEVDDTCTKARAVWWSIGVEGLSKHQEQPMAILSLGMVPGTHVVENGAWKILSGAWQRTTKNEYHAGWVHDMQVTNTRPPLTPEEDRRLLGKYAYRKDEVRRPVPEPPRPDTWQKWPDEADDSWMYANLETSDRTRGIIFDLDGVLVFTDRYHYLAWKKLTERLGIPFDEQVNSRLRGVSRMQSLEIILENGPGARLKDEEKLALAEEKNGYYREFLEELTPEDIDEGVRRTLGELHRRGYYLAVGSSSRNAATILEKTGLRSAFDAVSDGNNIIRSKPDPEVFLKAADMLRLRPGECTVVEDAFAGIEAAKAGGMTAVGIGTAAQCPQTDYAIGAVSDLLQIYG